LVGECLEQLDLSVSEWPDLSASDDNGTDGNTRTDQGDRQQSTVPIASGKIATLCVRISFGL
jgi:hypothetical protein